MWREENQWTWERELLASLVELTDWWGRLHATLLGAKGLSGKPVQVPRPEAVRPAKKKPTTDMNKIRRFFERTG